MQTDILTVRLSLARKSLVVLAAEGERLNVSRWAGEALTRAALRTVAAQVGHEVEIDHPDLEDVK